jgi:hypothetical protein
MKSAIHSAIFKTFFLSLAIISQVHFAFAQTASILPPAKTTFFDSNGNPLTAGQVFFYIPNTTTPKTTWQDSAETIPNTNPVTLDAAGRALILGSGIYRQLVKDQNGNTIWDAVTASVGSGGGGSTATGDGDLVGTIKPWAGPTAPNQYMFAYGEQVSRTTFAALFTAITSAQPVFCSSGSPVLTGLSDTTNFWVGMTVEVSCLSGGFSTILSKTSTTVTLNANANVNTNVNATFFLWGNGNGTTTFSLPDLRGNVLAGNCNMGGSACSNLTTAFFGAQTPNGAGATGGSQQSSLLLTNLPSIPVSGTITNGAITITQNANIQNNAVGVAGAAGFTVSSAAAATISASQAASTFTGNNTGGSSTAFANVPPTKTVNFIIKVTPDQNSSVATGVTSLGLMTGDISCGVGVLCTGNSISLSASSINITAGTTTVSAGTNNGVLWDNAGILAATTTMPTGLTAPAFTVTGSLTATGLVTNADLVNAATTVNGQTCTLGSTCTITASAGTITVGTTTIASATNTNVLFNNAGVLGQYTITGTGSVVMSASPTLTGIPVLAAPTATSIALGGATIGGNALAVTGTALFNTAVTMGAALTYGGVTLANSVTGTGGMVLATSPTIATPNISAPVFSGTATGTYTLGGTPSIAGSAINSGTVSGSFISNINLAASGNGGVTGILPIANGGTAGSTAQGARASTSLNIDEATSTGDANYSILATDRLIYHTALSAARTDTLPAANSVNAGQVFYMVDFAGVASATHTVTLAKAGSDTINGVTTAVALNVQYGTALFWSDGTSKWTLLVPGTGGGGSGTVTSVVVAAGSGVTLSGTCTITVSGTCTVTGSVPEPQGRLTLAANTPVMGPTSCSSTACTNQTTLRYDCYIGATVPYYTGSIDLLDTISSCEVTDAMVSAASAGQVVGGNVYDVWWVHSGANRICLAMSASGGGGGGWSADTGGTNTARGTGYSQLDRTTRGYTTNKNSIANCFNGATNYGSVSANQATYLGTVTSSGNGQVSYTFGTIAATAGQAIFGVWNMYNRRQVLTQIGSTGSSANYTTANTWRQAFGSSTMNAQYVVGLSEDQVSAQYNAFALALGSVNCDSGIGVDSTAAFSGSAGITAASSTATAIPASFAGNPGVGLHALYAIEAVSSATGCTFYGAGGIPLFFQTALTVNLVQ